MVMELRAADSNSVGIYDETGKIGDIVFVGPDEEDPAGGWCAEMYGFRDGRIRHSEYLPTISEAVAVAHELYEDLLVDRRAVNRFYRNQRTRIIAIPMGGQPKR